MSSQRKQPYHLVILATHTKEKVEHYQTIARKKGWPASVVSINRIAEAIHAAAEDTGDKEKNARQKSKSTEEIINLCRTNKKYKEALKRICDEEGIIFDPDKTYFITEDSQIIFESMELWKKVRRTFTSFANKVLLDRADANRTRPGPGAETGPLFASTLGWKRAFEFVRRAALRLGLNRVFLKDEAVIAFTKLSDSNTGPVSTVEESVRLCFSTPFMKDEADFSKDPIIATRHIFATPSDPDTPLSEKWEKFLPNESVRSKVFEAFLKKIMRTNKIRPVQKNKRPIKQSLLDPSDAIIQTAYDFTWDSLPANATNADIAYNLFTPNINLNVADAIVIPPKSELSPKDQFFAEKLIIDSIVEKSTEASKYNKPLIIMNNGSWDHLLNFVYYTINTGTHGDHIRPSFSELWSTGISKKVQHLAFGYMDVLNCKSLHLLENAKNTLLKHRLKSYNRNLVPKLLDDQIREYGKKPDKDQIFVGTWTSHSSANKKLLSACFDISAHITAKGRGHFSGAGDAEGTPMNATIDGAIYGNKTSGNDEPVAGYTTPNLAKIESETGHMSDKLTYGVLVPTIAKRESFLVTAPSANAAIGGGMGMGKETKGHNTVSTYAPEAMKGQKLILSSIPIHGKGQPGCLDVMAESFYGKDTLKAMKKNPYALANEGVLYADSVGLTKELMDQEVEAYEWRNKKRSKLATLAT